MKLWIGRAEVFPLPTSQILKGAKGAFVNVISPAENAADFRNRVVRALSNLAVGLKSLEETKPIDWFGSRTNISEDLERLAVEAEASGEPRFSTFHKYESEDEKELGKGGVSGR